MLSEEIKLEIIIYLVIRRNLLNLAAIVEYMEMTISLKKAQCVSWFIDGKTDI